MKVVKGEIRVELNAEEKATLNKAHKIVDSLITLLVENKSDYVFFEDDGADYDGGDLSFVYDFLMKLQDDNLIIH